MNQEQKRIKLAEAGGWLRMGADLEYAITRPEGRWEKGELTVFHFGQLPDYFNDLNAMHELEKVLTEEQREQYAIILIHRISGGGLATVDGYTNYDDSCDVITASAAQRAEAIGLTLGLWEACK